jgi:hypothetical protein
MKMEAKLMELLVKARSNQNLGQVGYRKELIKDIMLLVEIEKASERKAGIKEVVDWIEEQSDAKEYGKIYVISPALWQAKLKEWGIDET